MAREESARALPRASGFTQAPQTAPPTRRRAQVRTRRTQSWRAKRARGLYREPRDSHKPRKPRRLRGAGLKSEHEERKASTRPPLAPATRSSSRAFRLHTACRRCVVVWFLGGLAGLGHLRSGRSACSLPPSSWTSAPGPLQVHLVRKATSIARSAQAPTAVLTGSSNSDL
jgi:hypothetical protein